MMSNILRIHDLRQPSFPIRDTLDLVAFAVDQLIEALANEDFERAWRHRLICQAALNNVRDQQVFGGRANEQ